jgi:CheY-like chemotaxis protein
MDGDMTEIAAEADRRPTILVVDDEIFVRQMAVDAIEDAGYHVLEAGDADEALQCLETHADIAVMFSDIRMPGSMDGVGLAAMVEARWPNVAVILTSGHMHVDDLPSTARFLPKPYRTSVLTARIDELNG